MDWFFREHLQFAPSSLPKPQKALDVGAIGILHCGSLNLSLGDA